MIPRMVGRVALFNVARKKWVSDILGSLLDGPKSFEVLRRAVSIGNPWHGSGKDLTPNILSGLLHDLVEVGFLTANISWNGHRRHVTYGITPRGSHIHESLLAFQAAIVLAVE